MNTFILYGDKADAGLVLPLCRVLESLGGVQYFGQGRAAAYGSGTGCRFLLWETEELLCCDIPGAVVIPKQDAPALTSKAFTLCGQALPALSSLGDKDAVVELRQPLPRLGGGTLEPGEYIVPFTAPLEGYALLICCAVVLMCQ